MTIFGGWGSVGLSVCRSRLYQAKLSLCLPRRARLGIHIHNNMQKICKELGYWAGNVKTTSLLAPALSNNGFGWEGRAILTNA